MALEAKQEVDRSIEQFRLVLLGSDPLFWANKLYPEFLSDDGDYNLEEKNVEWKFPEMTEEEREQLLQELMSKDPDALTFDEYESAQMDEDW